jgi:citrate lyase beta subunit
MDQQDCHEDGIRPGKQAAKTTSRTHAVREDQVTQVVRVTGKAPPTWESRVSAIKRK